MNREGSKRLKCQSKLNEGIKKINLQLEATSCHWMSVKCWLNGTGLLTSDPFKGHGAFVPTSVLLSVQQGSSLLCFVCVSFLFWIVLPRVCRGHATVLLHRSGC